MEGYHPCKILHTSSPLPSAFPSGHGPSQLATVALALLGALTLGWLGGNVAAAMQGQVETLAELEISTWSYKTTEEDVRHMGPTAQDFHAAFGLGSSDKRITTVDPDGVMDNAATVTLTNAAPTDLDQDFSYRNDNAATDGSER